MFSLLPLMALVAIALLVQPSQSSARRTLLAALLVWGTLLTGITEVLSGLTLLRLPVLLLTWLVIDGLLIVAYLQRHKTRWGAPVATLSQRLGRFSQLPPLAQVQILGIGLTAGGIGLVAFMSAPNHSDSMEYHLSRIMHWMQNHSVAHYPTHDIFQLYQNPWSEFAITHLQILSQGDRFAGLVQWGSMVGCLVGVSLIAKALGGTASGQILAAVFCVTIPMGMLQGSSTNNDYVVALWLVCFAYWALLVVQTGATPSLLLGLGMSLGLAILTKGTAYLYAFPICLWLAAWGIRRYGLRVWQRVLPVAAIALSLNFGHYSRNLALFGSPLGAPGGETMAGVGPRVVIASIVKQLSLHSDVIRYLKLDGIITPLTGVTEKVVRLIHDGLGIDINDPAFMSPKFSNFYVPGLSFNEDSAGNPIHLLLIFLALVLIVVNGRLRQRSQLLTYGLIVTAGFILFCALLTWSPARCRLHLPLFVLFAGLVGTVFASSFHRLVVSGLAIFLLIFSSPWVFQNSVRPLLGENSIFRTTRTAEYFATQPALESLYREAAQVIQGSACEQVGLAFAGTSFEYPFWRLVGDRSAPLRMQHVAVDNESSPKTTARPFEAFEPCKIVYFSSRRPEDTAGMPSTPSWSEGYEQTWAKAAEVGKSQKAVQILTPLAESP